MGRMIRSVWRGFMALCVMAPMASWAQDAPLPAVALGERLFGDVRFSNPGSQFSTSCASCHTPVTGPKGPRSFTDSEPRSLIPSSEKGAKLTTLRNAPTLIGAGKLTRFDWDGQYDSLEALVRDKMTGVQFGWLPGESARALDEIHTVLQNDNGELAATKIPYAAEFKTALDVDVASVSRDELLAASAKAIAEYVATLAPTRSARYDAFAFLNRINPAVAVADGDTPVDFAGRLFGRLMNQEGRQSVKAPLDFDMLAYKGLKIFFGIDGMEHQGNCVACHYPPDFTDNLFHNTGVSGEEYDSLHGPGSFGKYLANPKTPSDATRARPDKADPSKADLGHWNFAGPASPLRKEGEAEEFFQARMRAAFKTPALLNPALTDPYMHNGAYATTEDALRQKMRAGQAAREAKDTTLDPEMALVNISEDDIPALAAFLNMLNEVGPDDYRHLIADGTHTLDGPFE